MSNEAALVSENLPSEPLKTDWPTIIYFALLTTVLALLFIQSTPIQYIEKQGLGMTPEAISRLTFYIGFPAYFGFLAGMLRDRWKPFGLGDRAYFFICGPVMGIASFYIGHGHMTQGKLLVGLLMAGIFGQMLGAAQHGLSSEISKRAGLGGSISTAFNVMTAAVAGAGLVIGGFLQVHFSTSQIFDLVTLLCFSLAIFGIWQPHLVSDTKWRGNGPKTHLGADLKLLLKCKPMWLAVLINFLWNFGPGTGTATFFLLTNQVHLNPVQYSIFRAVLAIAFVPTLLLYGFLCRKYPMRKLLWILAVIGIPQWIFFPFMHSYAEAIWLAIFVGVTGGGLTAAIWDLTMRSTPTGLEGTAMLLVTAGNALIINGGDIFGSWLYELGGFIYCSVAITVIYALIVPVVLMVPRSITDEKELQAIAPAA